MLKLNYAFQTIILSLVIIIIGLGVFIFSVKQTPPDHFSKLDKTDRHMFRAVSKIYNSFAKQHKTIWNENFDVSKIPVVLVRTDRKNGFKWPYAYLLNFPESEISAISHQVKMPEKFNLPSVYAAETLGIASLHLWSSESYGFIKLSNNKPFFFFKYYPDQFKDEQLTFDQFSSIFVHHLFHKEIHGVKSSNYHSHEEEDFITTTLSLDNFALQKLEYLLLDKALMANTKETTDKYMKQWLAVRLKRYSQWQDLRWETYREAFEGPALYVSKKLQSVAGLKSKTPSCVKSKMKPFSEKFNSIIKTPNRYYSAREELVQEVGASLSLLLDKVVPEWKNKFGHGQTGYLNTQFGILSNHYQLTDEQQVQLLKQTKQEFDYDQLFNHVMLRMTAWQQ